MNVSRHQYKLHSRRCRRLIKLALSPTELTRLLENVRENFVRQVGSEDVEGGLSLWGARGLRRRRADALPLLRSSLRPLGSRFPCHCLPQLSKRIYPSDQRTRREQVIIRFRTRTDALVSQPEAGKISCVHLPRCARLLPGACRHQRAGASEVRR